MSGLSETQVEFFKAEGYLASLPCLSEADTARYRDVIDRFGRETGLNPGQVIRNKGYLKLKDIYPLSFEPRILDAVESLLGPDILCWGSSLFIKGPRTPDFVAWHQDGYYWAFQPQEAVTAWIALEPSTRENGALQVIPRSHKSEAIEHRPSDADSRNMLFTHEELAVEPDVGEAVSLSMEPGQMSLHDVRIVHGSPANKSARRRMGYAITYVPTHVRQRGDRTTATLVRGQDHFGHFDGEPVPKSDLDPAIMALVDGPDGALPRSVARGPNA